MTACSYDVAYDPPLPVCEVTLTVALTGRQTTVDAIVDTGADATIVPVRLLRHIGARRVFQTTLRSQWGERRSVFLYLVDLTINEVLLPGVYVVGDEIGNEVVLGRNVLNKLVVTLDGPQQIVRIGT